MRLVILPETALCHRTPTDKDIHPTPHGGRPQVSQPTSPGHSEPEGQPAPTSATGVPAPSANGDGKAAAPASNGDGTQKPAPVATAPVAVGGHGGGRPGRRIRYTADLTTGSVRKHLWKLAWPQWLENVLGVLEQVIDLFWAGRLAGGYRSIAGLGVAQTFTTFGPQVRMGFDQGLRAMVSRAVGAGDIALANHISLQALTLTLLYSLVMIAIGFFLTDFLLGAIAVSDAIKAETSAYMKVQFMGTAGIGFRNVAGSMLQASGDVMTPLKATTVFRVVSFVLTPLLMFGWLGFPAFGLMGVAIAYVIAQLAGAVVNYWALFRGTSRLHLTFRSYRVDFRILGRMLRIGIPASIAGTERAISQLVLLRLVTPFGDTAVAAYSLARRIEMVTNFGGMGIGNAAGIMVGQNLGAGKPDRARQALKWGLAIAAAVKLVVGALVFASAAYFVLLFTTEAGVVDMGATWLRIVAISALFLGLTQVFQQAFNTAGDTGTVALIVFASVFFIEMPLAWVLAYPLGMGPLGVAYANLIGVAARTGFFVPMYYWDRWLKIKVI